MVNGKVKILEIPPEVDETRNKRNKLMELRPIRKTENREHSEKFPSREHI